LELNKQNKDQLKLQATLLAEDILKMEPEFVNNNHFKSVLMQYQRIIKELQERNSEYSLYSGAYMPNHTLTIEY